MAKPFPLKIGIDISIAEGAPEIKYIFRTLLRIAGFPYHFSWVKNDGDKQPLDIFYGPRERSVKAKIKIRSSRLPFSSAPYMEPEEYLVMGGLSFISFGGKVQEPFRRNEQNIEFINDIIFSSYWLLTGARESHYPRDRWDNLKLDNSFYLKYGLFAQPMVSQYGYYIRNFFKDQGRQPLELPWVKGSKEAVVSFTHDVDYPEIIKWLESIKLVLNGGSEKVGSMVSVLNGTNNFWRFDDWVEFSKRYHTKPTFFFMAKKGSLLKYALGTPDAFYDIFDPKFGDLFRSLKADGCKIGLHSSYKAYSDAEALKREKLLLEEASQAQVYGLRHHYWHLNPEAPNETLYMHEQVGFIYDSSLAFEFYPGFRRGICHPFHPFYPSKRRELDLVELPPAWMDDHFDRRRAKNDLKNPDEFARDLLETAKSASGTVITDYHVRGMNFDFFPRYGKWLINFSRNNFDDSIAFMSAEGLVTDYLKYESILNLESIDQADEVNAIETQSSEDWDFEVKAARESELGAVARMHYELFGTGELHGYSIAKLGPEFLDQIFYRLNHDNPYFLCDVAKYKGKVVGFSLYTTNQERIFREMIRRHFIKIGFTLLTLMLKKPSTIVSVMSNLRYVFGETLSQLDAVNGWWIVAGVHPNYRSMEFKKRTGIYIAQKMFDKMEERMRNRGCKAWYGVVHPENYAINSFLRKQNALDIGMTRSQGMLMRYYIKRFE